MVVEAFHGDLTDEELELVTNPENWFLRVPQQGTSSFLSALESWSRREKEGRTRTARKSFSSSKSTKRPQGFRLEKLAKSLLRPDKRQPPLCIFCLDDGSDTNDSCGKLLWCPSLPNFFAIHELCALMTPEVLTVDNPSPLGAMMFETDLKQLQSAFIRGRPLVCNVCHERGALVGCCCSKCRLVFHLPCAMRSQCYIDYEDFRCFCSKHSAEAFKGTVRSIFATDNGKKTHDGECCLCMEAVESKVVLHGVVRTNCCGTRFYHYDCMKNATIVRGQELRCPACNRPNEETGFEEIIKRQGIYLQTYNPPEERDINGTEENARSRCYYAMPRCSAKNKTCVSRIGPDKYDDSDALNDSVFNPHEALNACITCGVHSHRICAGPPWSTYTPGGDYDEEKWQCEDCRGILSPSVHFPVTSSSFLFDQARSSESPDSSDLDSLNDLELDVGNRMMPDDGGKCELSQIVERRVQKRACNGDNSPTGCAPARKQALLHRWFSTVNRP
ncbi:hypothetical protein Q1695_006167 [Nippostrongylus brasiliensis]|nr:hypothetical protein Q1695_006167 [Nippostrongylus brasiliensis]